MSTPAKGSRLGVIGCGAIGYELIKLLHAEPVLSIAAVAVRPERLQEHGEQLRPLRLADRLCLELPSEVDLVIEIGGHSAIAQHVVPALQAGISCVLASVGALADEALFARVQQSAREGGAQVQVIPGAIGGIDALAAARLAGLEEVVYTGSKPPGAWRDTPAEAVTDLETLKRPVVIFEGSARDAARLYPRNANVTATVALAGLGFDATRLRLVADPSLRQNTHRLQARGGFGEFDIRLANEPLAANPKTSALTIYSAMRAVLNRVNVLSI